MATRKKKFADFSLRLREACDFADLEFQELADLIGVSRNSISAYVNGVQMPNGEKLIAIGKALKVSLDWLLTGATDNLMPQETYYPPLFGGEPQSRLALGYQASKEIGDFQDLIWYVHQDRDYRFAPDWCLAWGDWVLIDTSCDQVERDDIYLLQMEPEAPPALRPILVRNAFHLMEASWGEGGVNTPFRKKWEILGRAVGRSSPM